MIPSFEKRVRAFAIDTSGVMLIILALPMRSTFQAITWDDYILCDGNRCFSRLFI